MSKLQLYLRGALFQETDIELPEYQQLDENEQKNFELNCQMRIDFVKAESTKLKLQYLRQVLKCNNEFEIYLVTGSKIEQPYFFPDSTQ